MRGGDAVIHALEKEGVEYISGFSGSGLPPLWPALKRSETIRAFSTRHERLGVEIADGYARATGKVGVAMTGTGPGATNTLTGVAGCYADNVPVLLLMGQHPLGSMGKEIQQEVPSTIFDSLVKWMEGDPKPRGAGARDYAARLHSPALRLTRPGSARDAPGCSIIGSSR
jgi:thiamine pyrophosphate-dependent acetolactate synthase large subunit-like protein